MSQEKAKMNLLNINLENKKGYYKKEKGVELHAWS